MFPKWWLYKCGVSCATCQDWVRTQDAENNGLLFNNKIKQKQTKLSHRGKHNRRLDWTGLGTQVAYTTRVHGE